MTLSIMKLSITKLRMNSSQHSDTQHNTQNDKLKIKKKHRMTTFIVLALNTTTLSMRTINGILLLSIYFSMRFSIFTDFT
jgi:hypothetical protein